MIKTLTTSFTLTEALRKLQNGECIGIRPNDNCWYLTTTKKNYMDRLVWNEDRQAPSIATLLVNNWYLVVEELTPEEKIDVIKKLVDNATPDYSASMSEIKKVLEG